MLGRVGTGLNSSTQKAEVGGSLWVQDKPDLQNELQDSQSLSQKKKKTLNKQTNNWLCTESQPSDWAFVWHQNDPQLTSCKQHMKYTCILSLGHHAQGYVDANLKRNEIQKDRWSQGLWVKATQLKFPLRKLSYLTECPQDMELWLTPANLWADWVTKGACQLALPC